MSSTQTQTFADLTSAFAGEYDDFSADDCSLEDDQVLSADPCFLDWLDGRHAEALAFQMENEESSVVVK